MKSNRIIKTATFCLLGFLFSNIQAKAQSPIDLLDIPAADSIAVPGGTTINNLVVHADKFKCGQLIIQSGVVNVKKMTYKFTITPTEWTLLSFPSDIVDVNLETSSNFASLGLTQNSGTKRYIFKRYDSQARSSGKEPWVQTTTPALDGNKGYLLYVYTGNTTPVELEFYFDNMTLDKGKTINQLLIDLDMNGKVNLKDYQMTVKPANIKGNTLNITVHNAPEAGAIPVNYQEAVQDAKIYFTENNEAIRISLPNSENCKVLIMDKKMKKVLKAIDYVSPGAIPVNNLKKGTYKLYLEYGNSSDVKTFSIK